MESAPSLLELVVRLVFSLGVIGGLLWLGAKVARRNGGALRLPGAGRRRQNAITVVDRQSLTRNASLAVVEVGARTMVVGVTEHGVTLLSEHSDLTGKSVDEDVDEHQAGLHLVTAPPLEGHLISPEAKRTAPRPELEADTAAPSTGHTSRMSLVEALRELTVRKA
jgi:flagellar protein FliO/FliZ